MAELASSFLLDYESLDRDHQQLNEMLNEIVRAIDGGEANKCRDLVPEFVKFAKKHFSRERFWSRSVPTPSTTTIIESDVRWITCWSSPRRPKITRWPGKSCARDGVLPDGRRHHHRHGFQEVHQGQSRREESLTR